MVASWPGRVFDGAPRRAACIMTGAPMPAGADTVYPQEIVERSGRAVRIPAGPAGVNVRHRGEDVRAGSVVLTAGTALRPQELGVAASLGLPQLLVHQRPRVAILSTGDEVAEPGDPRKPGQIFDSNRFSLHGLVHAAGRQTTDHGIVPDLYDVLHAACARPRPADVVLTSGGVSVGTTTCEGGAPGRGRHRFLAVDDAARRPLAVGRIGSAHFFGPAGNRCLDADVHLSCGRLWKLAGPASCSRPASTRSRWRRWARSRAAESSAASSLYRRALGGAHHRTPGLRILTSMTLAHCFVVIEEERGDVAAGDTVSVEPFALA